MVLFSGCCVAAIAQAGTLEGYVSETAVGGSLEGAEVKLSDGRSTVTNRRGYYRFANVSGGEYQLTVNYIGAESQTLSVNVTDSGVTSADVRLIGEVYELEAFEVNSAPSGTSRALNLQRSASNYRNVVASDYFGRFPDGNAAEALGRLPGVTIERDQGEGRFVVIRGIDPNLNSVSIDGVSLASPSADERKTLLDTIPTEVMGRIELTKVVLPSQPGDSIGGHIEISTPSAFDVDSRILRVNASSIYTDLTEDFGYEGTIAYGDRFGENRNIGFHLTLNYSERSFGSDNQESDEWELEDSLPDVGEEFYAQNGAMEFREYDLTRNRIGLAANLEFKPTSDSFYYIRGSYNDYKDVEQRQLGALDFDFEDEGDENDPDDDVETEITALSASSQTAINVEAVKEYKDREESMRVSALSAGGENRFSNYTLDYKVAYSFAEEDTPYDFEAVYELEDLTEVRVDGTDSYNPTVTNVGGADFTDASLYEFNEIVDANQIVEEDDFSLQANFRGDFEKEDATLYIQTGVLYRQKTKTSDLEESAFEFENGPPAEVATLDAIEKKDVRDPFHSGFPHLSTSIRDYHSKNIALFESERDLEASSVEDYDIDEDVTAAYLMFGLNSGSLEFILGTRVERTETKSTGFTYADGDDFAVEVEYDKSYTNWMPGAHLKYDINDDMIVRLAWTNTIARPTFGQSYPGVFVDGDEVERGNPDLDPYEASNFDLSFEYYMDNIGLFSVALFRKDIENFIYEQTSEPDNMPGVDELTTFRNGPSGEVQGIEFAFQRQMEFLPGFGVSASATFTDGEADVLAEDEGDPNRSLPFVKQSDFIGQVALTYEYSRFFVRLAGTHRSSYLDEVGGEPLEDRYVDDHFQMDLSTAYYVNKNFTINMTINNITNEPFRAYWGESRRLSQFEEYGIWGTLGIEWKL